MMSLTREPSMLSARTGLQAHAIADRRLVAASQGHPHPRSDAQALLHPLAHPVREDLVDRSVQHDAGIRPAVLDREERVLGFLPALGTTHGTSRCVTMPRPLGHSLLEYSR